MRREAWLEGRADSSDTDREKLSWKAMWRVDVPPKLKIFLWRLAQQSISTADVMHHRNMSTTTCCGLCGAEDSWQHSLLHCTVARCVWALHDQDLVDALNSITEPDAKRWLFAIQDMLSSDDFILVATTLWAIWYARRQALHEHIFQSPLSTYNFILKYIRELEDCKTKKNPRVVARAELAQPRWVAPSEGTAKLRVDGAVSRDGSFGSFSAVCRSSSGSFLGASAIKIEGISDPATLEALACREALDLAMDLDLAKILIASDCQEVVNDIKNCTGGVYASTIREIVESKNTFDDCSFIFEGKATNIEAHSLAKHAFGLDFGRHVWLLNPPNISCIPMNIFE